MTTTTKDKSLSSEVINLANITGKTLTTAFNRLSSEEHSSALKHCPNCIYNLVYLMHGETTIFCLNRHLVKRCKIGIVAPVDLALLAKCKLSNHKIT